LLQEGEKGKKVMSLPRVLLSGTLTHKQRASGAQTFTCGDSEAVFLIFDPQTSSTLAQFAGRNIEILVRDIEPPSVWTTEEQLPEGIAEEIRK
jgi:hypothetical protein